MSTYSRLLSYILFLFGEEWRHCRKSGSEGAGTRCIGRGGSPLSAKLGDEAKPEYHEPFGVEVQFPPSGRELPIKTKTCAFPDRPHADGNTPAMQTAEVPFEALASKSNDDLTHKFSASTRLTRLVDYISCLLAFYDH